MHVKKCTKCLVEKDSNNFGFHKHSKDKLRWDCKDCRKEYRKINFERIKLQEKEYKVNNREKIKIVERAYCDKNKELRKQKRKQNRIKENALVRERYKNNQNYKLICNIRSRIRAALKSKNTKRKESINDLIGCSIPELLNYLESKLLSGMTLENRGFYTWHIDHVVPCDYFDLTIEEERRKCFHYTNLIPKWSTTKVARQNNSNQIGNLNKQNLFIG